MKTQVHDPLGRRIVVILLLLITTSLSISSNAFAKATTIHSAIQSDSVVAALSAMITIFMALVCSPASFITQPA